MEDIKLSAQNKRMKNKQKREKRIRFIALNSDYNVFKLQNIELNCRLHTYSFVTH